MAQHFLFLKLIEYLQNLAQTLKEIFILVCGWHLVSALINKFHNAKIENKNQVELWGTGNPRRDLLYVKDLAKA